MKKDYLKKLAALSVAAAMVFSMAACGNIDTATMQEMLLKVLPLLRKTLPKRITKN